MNDLVKQHNDMIDLPLRKFTASEIDILNSVCHEVQNKGTMEVVIPFDRLQKLSDYQAKDEKRFIKAIDNMSKKLMQLNIRVGTERKFTRFVLFPTFELDADKKTVTVGVHEKFRYILNDLIGNYTILELQECSSLRSSYAKSMYRKLCKFRDTGVWRVSIEEFREYMCVPKAYPAGKVQTYVIKVAIKELIPYFPGLKCQPYYRKKTSGRGRPAVAGYEFTFKMQPHEKKEPVPPTPEQIARKTEWTKTSWYCPNCHKQMYSKLLKNENGQYLLYGHPDFHTGECNFAATHVEDLLQKNQIPSDPTKDEPETEEQKENKNKLSEILGNLFG